MFSRTKRNKNLVIMTEQKKLQLIIEEVCKYYKQPRQMVCGHDRHREYATPRHVYCYFARELTGCSLKEIGGALRTGYDHASVLSAIRLIKGLVSIGVLSYEIQAVRAAVNNRILDEMNLERHAFVTAMGSLTWSREEVAV